ncbi:hypothetical protein GN244_ATG13085 [Phytophthora infestans]|uniref:Uncharacterized protein n=1 Tax=Phytophthora infestans TaxID=4787 RepID=A0A833WHH7_PHYIN|nr:hypothetical protein GN244_ATG13085 [Phytophthora infestans]
MDSETPDDRPHQRPHTNPQGTRWDVPPTGQAPFQTTVGAAQSAPRAPGAATQGSTAQSAVTPGMLTQMLQFALQITQQ